MSKREAFFAGSFYPNSVTRLQRYFDYFNQIAPNVTLSSSKPKAIIAPHAGYIYSGLSANCVYANLAKEIQAIVVIGPSHYLYFKGASVSLYQEYETPLANIEADTILAQKIYKQFDFCVFLHKAHQEHSTETQMPFIKHYLPNAKVVEIVYGDIAPKDLKEIVAYAIKEEALIVISTDLSHFYDLKSAHTLDKLCLSAIEKIDTNIAQSGCEACGIKGVEAVLYYAKENSLHSQIVDYRTSYDASGDDSKVVGYCSAIIF